MPVAADDFDKILEDEALQNRSLLLFAAGQSASRLRLMGGK